MNAAFIELQMYAPGQTQLTGHPVCSSPFKVKVKPGKHRFKVRATDGAGNTDPTPARAKFKRVAN